jgi:hypothetical protein
MQKQVQSTAKLMQVPYYFQVYIPEMKYLKFFRIGGVGNLL